MATSWTVLPSEEDPQAPTSFTVLPQEKAPTSFTVTAAEHPSAFQGPQKRVVDLSTSFPRVQRMIDMLQSGTAQFAEAGGGLLEAHGPGALQDTGQRIREEASKYTAPTMPLEQLGAGWDKLKWDDPAGAIKWLGDTASNIPEFLAENVVSQIPQMAANVGGAAVGGFLGGAAGALGGPAGAVAGARAGQLAGMGAVNYFLNAGETFANLRELGVSREAAAEAAGITGAGKAVLDTALPAKLLGSLAGKMGRTTFWVPKSAAITHPKLWSAILKGVGIEGTTEVGQELLDVWAEQQKGVGTPDKTVSRVLNAWASGAAGGGVFSGAEHIAERKLAKQQLDATPDPDLNPNAPPEPAEPALPVNPTLPSMPRPELPPPVPGTISETDVPRHIQDKVVGIAGQEGLFKAYDEAEMKNILGVDESVSLAAGLRQGLIMRDGEQYRLTEMATGVAPVEPVVGMPGMWRSIEQPYPKTFQYVAEADNTQRFTIDYTSGDPAAGTDDTFATVHNGEPVVAQTLDEIKEKIDGLVPVATQQPVAAPIAPGVPEQTPAAASTPITPEQTATLARLFPNAEHTPTPEGGMTIRGQGGNVIHFLPNGPIQLDMSGVTRVLTPESAAHLGGLRGTEVQVDPQTGADRQTMIHELGWHTFLELGATPEQRVLAQQLFPNEEDGAAAMARFLDGKWERQDAARNSLLKQVVEWFRQLYQTMRGGAENLFNQAGQGEWINNAPSPSRSVTERFEEARTTKLERANTFFDQLERTVDAKVPNAASAAQIWAIVTNPQSGVKTEQLRWTGLQEWLKEKGDKKVSKSEVLEFVRQNAVKITEILLSDNPYEVSRKERAALDARYDANEIEYQDYWDAVAELESRSDAEMGRTQHSSYKLPGGENYRELIMTLPNRENPDYDPYVVYDTRNNQVVSVHDNNYLAAQNDMIQRGSDYSYDRASDFERNTRQGWIVFNVWDGVPIATFATDEEARADAIRRGPEFDSSHASERFETDKGPAPHGGNFTHSHWEDVINPLAHGRYDDRVIEGKTTLFAEEIQSDLHQQGKSKGYKDVQALKEKAALDKQWGLLSQHIGRIADRRRDMKYSDRGNPEYEQLTRELTDYRHQRDMLTEKISEARTRTGEIPDAPFRNSWHELVFKRLLRHAAEGGYEQIAWADGKSHKDLYPGLVQQVSKLAYQGGYLEAWNHYGQSLVKKALTEAELPEYIGVDATKALKEALPDDNGRRVIDTKNLPVELGGRFLDELYDKWLVNFANKYGKKWGAKVQDTTIQVEDRKRGATRYEYTGPDYTLEEVKDKVENFYTLHPTAYTAQNRLNDISMAMEFGGESFRSALERHQSTRVLEWFGGYKEVEPATKPVTIYTFPITASMRQSVLYEGQPMFEARKPEPVPASDSSATRGLKTLNKMLRNIPREEGNNFRDIFGVQSKLLRHALSTTQLYDMVQRNPEWRFLAPTVKRFLDWSIKRKMEKNRVQLEADKVNRVWQKPGRETGKSIDTIVQQVAERSTELERRLTEPEIVSMARALKGDTAVILDAWKTIDGSMQKGLNMLEDALIEEANRTLGLTAPGHIAEIRKQIEQLRHRNYFPSTRFGNYGVLVKSNMNQVYEGKQYHAGQTVLFETRELESHGQALASELQAQWPSDKFTVTPRLITPVEQSFMSMPESLADYLKDHLDLTPGQFEDLKALQYQLAPGQGLVKHLIKKKGILGASRDSLRVYNDYYQKLSGHIAKIKTSGPMEKTIAEAKKLARTYSNDYKPQLIAETLERSYQDMQSVRNEWGAVAGGVFHTVFSFVPLAAIVNMTQVPVMTYPYLAKRSNDLIASGALARAAAKVGPTMDPRKTTAERNSIYAGEDRVFFDRAVDEAFLEESLAGEVATMASSNMLTRYFEGGVQFSQQLRWLMGKSIMFQKIAEEFNRRVTFHAALEVGRSKGLAGENLFDFARTAVQMTQFEYASWNRPRIMRGNKAVLFIFKTYLQNFLYFAKTNQGGMRFWLMLVAIGGLRGVPGADDLLDVIDLLGTWAKTFFGWKNPRVDAERAAREFISSVGANPDLLINGLARYSFGFAGLNTMFGIPFPAADFSASVQMTRIVPGMRMVKGLSQGTMKWSDAFLTAVNDVAGPAGSMGMNLTRAVLDDTPASSSKLVNMTQVSKNLSRAMDMATKGAYTDNDGTKLVDVDMTKPEHIGEVIMQFLGKRPTRASQKLEVGYADREQAAFYYARREIILTHWSTAIGEKDAEAREDARKEWVKFVKTAPTEFIMPVDQLRSELRQRVEKRTLKNMGLAPQKRLIKMRQDTEELYQSPFTSKETK